MKRKETKSLATLLLLKAEWEQPTVSDELRNCRYYESLLLRIAVATFRGEV